MLRHYRSRHETDAPVNNPLMNTDASRKQDVDDRIVNMIIKDCQPLSMVENEGFRELMEYIMPSYVLPTRKVIIKLMNWIGCYTL